MTEKELAEISERIAEERKVKGSHIIAVGLYTIAFEDAPKLLAEIERLRAAMRDAMENCEVCRWEDTNERRCARCQTFDKLLGEQTALDAAGGE